ncbi:MAG: hypothetical protein IH851_05410 [Armatimonadetes bacterium]|nr:hypothetical protein [Armatimonadota bacterium]
MRSSRYKALSAVGACVAVSLGMAAASAGPIEWDGNGHFYELVTSPKTWFQAKLDAEARTFLGVQGHLLTVNSQGEQDFINETFGPALREAYTGGFLGAQGWEWVTGEPFSYTNWAPYEPTGDGPVIDFHGKNNLGTWNDIPSHLQLNYFVEYDVLTEATIPDSFRIIRGIRLFGGLPDLFESDDRRLCVQTDVFAPSPQAPVQVEVVGTSPTETPTEFRFLFEGHAIRKFIAQRILLFNYVTQIYEELDLRFASTADEVVEIVPGGDLGRFVEPGTRQVKALMTWRAAGLSFFTGWHVCIDQTIWRISE